MAGVVGEAGGEAPNGDEGRAFVLAHLSDLHATPVRLRGPGEILNKRLLGWLSWNLRRHREHRGTVLDSLLADLRQTAPDHVAITGDLTNLGLEGEFEAAAAWLRRLGEPRHVSIVPGNHDVYVKTRWAETFELWADWMGEGPQGEEAGSSEVRFPTLRVRGPLAVVGASSACATPPFLATGRVGADQCERLEAILRAQEGRFRTVLIHHPPVAAGLSRRRQLTDAAALRHVLGRAGAELVLHGHAHRSHFSTLESPRGSIPVVGVSSASALGHQGGERRARYHLLRIQPRETAGAWSATCEVRALREDAAGFDTEDVHRLH